jgi:DNA-binding IclR family transcriptional regulator
MQKKLDILNNLRFKYYLDQDPDTNKYSLRLKFLSLSCNTILDNIDIRKAAFEGTTPANQ